MTYSSTDAARLRALKKVLVQGFINMKAGSIFLPFSALGRGPLFQDVMGLERLLRRIQNESDDMITFAIRKQTVISQAQSVADPSQYPSVQREVPVGIEVYVSETSSLEKELDRIVEKADGKKTRDRLIQSIEIVPRDEDGKANVIVNGHLLAGARNIYKDRWKALMEVAENNQSDPENAKGVMDYFNSDVRCPLYTSGLFDLTEVLVNDDGTLRAAPGVTIKKGSKQSLDRSRTRLLKNAEK